MYSSICLFHLHMDGVAGQCDPAPTNKRPLVFRFETIHLDESQFLNPWHTSRTLSYGEVNWGKRTQWKKMSTPHIIHPWVLLLWVLVHSDWSCFASVSDSSSTNISGEWLCHFCVHF
jgi:hypothetical protein